MICNTVERYARKGFEVVLADDKTLVKTNLQVFLLSPSEFNYRAYVREIRAEIALGHIKDWNELCGMFRHKESGMLVVSMIRVLEKDYV